MHSFRIIALWLPASVASAGQFSELVVFGDSLSDVGNRSAVTGGDQPGSDYFAGRFSNGPVFVDRLAAGLGLGPLVASLDGGSGYAFGGAETDGPSGGSTSDSLVEQVDAYLADLGASPADPDALHVVQIGGNDFLGGETNAFAPAGVVLQQVSRLADAGARHVLGVNLARLGLTPNNLGDDSLSELSVVFNEALDTAYTVAESLNPGLTVYRLDVEAHTDDIVADPARFGFTNVTGQGVGAADPAGYLYWDGLHPTTEAHALLGEAALRAVLPAGDHDRDGFVTAADYTAWTNGVGAAFDAAASATTGLGADANGDGRVDAADFTVWRDAVVTPSSQAVPEPRALAIAILAALSVAACSARRRAPGRSRRPAPSSASIRA